MSVVHKSNENENVNTNIDNRPLGHKSKPYTRKSLLMAMEDLSSELVVARRKLHRLTEEQAPAAAGKKK